MRKVIAVATVAGFVLAGCSTGDTLEPESSETSMTTSVRATPRPHTEWGGIYGMGASIHAITDDCHTLTNVEEGWGWCGSGDGRVILAYDSDDYPNASGQLKVGLLQQDRDEDEVILWDEGWAINCWGDVAATCGEIHKEYPNATWVDLEAGEGMDVQAEVNKIENGIQDGIRLVGSEVQPGTYKYDGSAGSCYWARLSGLGGTSADIIANGNERAQAYVTIDASDVAFESRGCGMWEKVE